MVGATGCHLQRRAAIGLERLKALPYARLCIECKEKEEAESS
jgi:RNA polymerase-binding transcription factor DksA